MEESAFRSEDRIGLLAAVVLHAALLAAIAVQAFFTPGLPATPPRMTVSLATEVSLESTAPDPVPESRAAIAPTLAELPAPEAVQSPVQPAETTPAPTPPRPETRPQPRPQPRATSQPERRRPEPARQQPAQQPPRQASNSGGSRIGDSFLEGAGASTRTEDTRIPADQIGPSAQASIIQQIVRQIRPHWTAPNGVDAEALVTELAFDLNPDGSLKGRPRVLRQSGITDSNRPQAPLHAERAIRAVQLAAPFDLPPEYYNAWKSIRGARFDRNLSR